MSAFELSYFGIDSLRATISSSVIETRTIFELLFGMDLVLSWKMFIIVPRSIPLAQRVAVRAERLHLNFVGQPLPAALLLSEAVADADLA